MENILLWVCGFIAQFTTQLMGCSLMFAFYMKRRKHFALKFILSEATFLALPYIMGYAKPWLFVGSWFMLAFFIYYLICGAIIYLCFDVSIRQTLFFISAAYVMQHCMDVTIWLFVYVFKLGFDELFTRIITTVIRLCMDAIFYFAFARRVKASNSDENGGFVVGNLYTLAITVIAIALVYVTSMYVSYKNWGGPGYELYSIFSCVLLLLFQFGLLEQGKKTKSVDELHRMLALEHEQHELSKENIDMINMKCHDIKHQIAALRKTSDSEVIKERLSELERAVMIYDCKIKTGNPALDVILTEKSLACESYGVKLSCIADGDALSFFKEEDIYSLFGNMMDNAIESAKKTSDEENRSISLNVAVKSGFLVIHQDNYCSETPIFENGLPKSTKADKAYHGYGTMSMRYISEKYGGTFKASVNGDRFNVNILIPLPA